MTEPRNVCCPKCGQPSDYDHRPSCPGRSSSTPPSPTVEELARWESKIDKFHPGCRDTILRLVGAVRAQREEEANYFDCGCRSACCCEPIAASSPPPSPTQETPAELTEALDALDPWLLHDRGCGAEAGDESKCDCGISVARAALVSLYTRQREEIEQLKNEAR